MMYLKITTNRETADKIKMQCKFDEKIKLGRSYELGEINHHTGYSIVHIKPKAEKIKVEDIFWLGFFSGACWEEQEI